MRRAIWRALCRDLIESVQKENRTSIALKTHIERSDWWKRWVGIRRAAVLSTR